MLINDINKLKRKLESQILNKEEYKNIYDTSVKIDELLVKYYMQGELTKYIKWAKWYIK